MGNRACMVCGGWYTLYLCNLCLFFVLYHGKKQIFNDNLDSDRRICSEKQIVLYIHLDVLICPFGHRKILFFKSLF